MPPPAILWCCAWCPGAWCPGVLPPCVARREASVAENNIEPTETSREKEIVFIGALLRNTFVGGTVIKGGGKQNDPCRARTKHTGV